MGDMEFDGGRVILYIMGDELECSITEQRGERDAEILIRDLSSASICSPYHYPHLLSSLSMFLFLTSQEAVESAIHSLFLQFHSFPSLLLPLSLDSSPLPIPSANINEFSIFHSANQP